MHFSTRTITILAVNAFFATIEAAPLVCYEDNPLRSLENSRTAALAFCPGYLAGTQTAPAFMTGFPASRISSACKCFETTAVPSAPVPVSPSATSTPAPIKVPTTTKTSTTTPVVVAPTSKSPSTTSSVVITPSSSTAPINTLPVTPASGVAKRGLVYDYKSHDWSKYFVGSKYVSFGSDWHDTRDGTGATLDPSFSFVPTLNVDGGLNNANFIADVTALIKSGTKVIFSSNEPDNKGQANLSPNDAATVYKKYMQPFAGQATLCTPAVTNGGGATGLGWLENFVKACDTCHFDAINIHHYVQRSDVDVPTAVKILKDYIDNKVPALQAKYPKQLGGLKLYLGEFWLWGASDSEGSDYLKQIMPYLDANDKVAGYQAFGGLWQGNFINSAGTGLTQTGQTYRDYYAAA